ncbi:UNVERIFIED_CONTAM: hypothetical protein GTU68_057176 [Idotea baltica]|nr:hypothetical protein [Idotea baltica]
MTYKIKEIYYTLQGEGHHTGRPAVFCRFTGCNLWSGLEKDRDTAICRFCDTEFFGMDGQGGGKYTAAQLVQACLAAWPSSSSHPPFVVCTGGEPMLQVNEALIDEFHAHKFEVACETNGTLPCPPNIDWICMSPKANTDIILNHVNEIKLVYPQADINPIEFNAFNADHLYLQPMDNIDQAT